MGFWVFLGVGFLGSFFITFLMKKIKTSLLRGRAQESGHEPREGYIQWSEGNKILYLIHVDNEIIVAINFLMRVRHLIWSMQIWYQSIEGKINYTFSSKTEFIHMFHEHHLDREMRLISLRLYRVYPYNLHQRGRIISVSEVCGARPLVTDWSTSCIRRYRLMMN